MILKNLKTIKNLSFQRNLSSFRKLLDIHPTVKNALHHQEPVVALESTIITHGMPYPQNLETAFEVEDIVRSAGATPATIALMDGRLKVGLSKDDIVQLAKMERSDVIKSSRRDLAYVISNGKCGGTTVAATMIVAHMAGIKIFATGGVGGVHRDGHITMDVSADLVELGRTPVTVVSSGVKSILDIPRTLEYLETQGVCVAAYNSEGGKFPDFYTRDSGCKAPYNLQNPLEAAKLINALHQLQLQSGILIGVPIPAEYAADKDLITAAINQAYKDAAAQGVEGKEVTPFLLAAIAKITGGSSLKANMALIKNNAHVAAKIACELSNTVNKNAQPSEHTSTTSRNPLVIGASMLDLCLTMLDDIPLNLDGATYRTSAKESGGGVGRNLAEAIYKLNGAASFVSVIGKDHMGQSLLQLIPESMRHGILIDQEKTTSICSIIFDKFGNCKMCLANMEIHKSLTPKVIRQQEEQFKHTPLVVIDGNLSVNTIETILELSLQYNKPVFFEPTDMLIAGKPFELDTTLTQQIRLITPNVFELKAIVETITGKKINWQPNTALSSQELLVAECQDLLKLIENKFDCIVVTLGAHGVLVNLRGNSFEQKMFEPSTGAYINYPSTIFSTRFYAAPSIDNIANVSGAGDSLSSGFITGLLRGLTINDSIAFGFLAAKRSLQSNSAVPEQYFANSEEEQKLLNNEIDALKYRDV
ncbi:pseudouridine-metabolizing bifunctional protein C1861.05-like [Lucilia sericata]|uniref:pseudouridine-metabolizing bifunctional protein C1861.05-like n=1 Tax=Lucilia sericata TaxID=13632 RepID=UPI0018A87B6C|nr:pseudouridine-metabolizing bifunctional protein C1861.05-like [Lucilia sericata]XP_037826714.1 pseudouridine-metabolizing bifunctional protein C1861.05-like [Lucilia sericata]